MLERDFREQMGQFPSGYCDLWRWQFTNLITDIFEKWLSFSHLNPFTADMFDVQPPKIMSLLGFMITENYGLSSKDALEPSTVAIYPSLHPPLSKVFTEIEKAFFHRIASAYVTSTWFSRTFFLAGKVPQLILVSGLMHWQKGFQHLKDFIILQMQDIRIARTLWFPLVVFGTIFRSGVLQVFGMSLVALSDVSNIFKKNPIAQ
jgi:hypothetical protein